MTKKPRAKTMSELARRGAAARNLRLWLNDENRRQPSLPRIRWLERPDPWAEPEKDSAG